MKEKKLQTVFKAKRNKKKWNIIENKCNLNIPDTKYASLLSDKTNIQNIMKKKKILSNEKQIINISFDQAITTSFAINIKLLTKQNLKNLSLLRGNNDEEIKIIEEISNEVEEIHAKYKDGCS